VRCWLLRVVHVIGLPVASLKLLFLLQNKQTSWSESARELYRPSNRRLQANLVPAFADRRCCRVSTTDPYGRIFGFLYRSRYLFFQIAP
jgi:hypothetical protein